MFESGLRTISTSKTIRKIPIIPLKSMLEAMFMS